MIDLSRILVVAATPQELAALEGWLSLACGVGPVEAAAATAATLARHGAPAAVIHVGIAGARRASRLTPPALVIGVESRYCDLHVQPTWAPSVVTAPQQLVHAAREALPSAVERAIGTSARVGGSTNCDVEAMEGFGVLRAAQLAGVPAIEVRAIANAIEDEDRRLWRVDEAFAVIRSATAPLVAAIARCAD